MMICFDSCACVSATLSAGYTILSHIHLLLYENPTVFDDEEEKKFSVTSVTCKHSTVELADLVDGLMYREREKR